MIWFTAGFLLTMIGCSGLDGESVAASILLIVAGLSTMLIAEGKHFRNS